MVVGMVQKLKIKKGDSVVVLTGRDKGKTGEVLKVLRAEQRLIVQGVNTVKRHSRPSAADPQGGIVEKEAPLYSARVMLVCPKCGQAARVGHGYLGDGTKIRVCKNCGEQIEK